MREFLSDENFELSGYSAIDDEVGWGGNHNLEKDKYFEIRFFDRTHTIGKYYIKLRQ